MIVWEEDQVITEDDLKAIRNGYVYQYQNDFDEEERYKFLIAIGTVDSIIEYLRCGKITKENS